MYDGVYCINSPPCIVCRCIYFQKCGTLQNYTQVLCLAAMVIFITDSVKLYMVMRSVSFFCYEEYFNE